MRIIQIGVGKKRVPLVGYLQDFVDDGGVKNIRPSIIICAGGGFQYLSWREQDHIAMIFLSQGYQVFLLNYSLNEQAKDLNPLIEASDAVVEIRRHGTEWLCDPFRIAIMGFSAGGQVAASLAILHADPRIQELMPCEKGLNRPDACILCYPVITTGKYRHDGSIQNVTGGDKDMLAYLKLEDQVTDDTPPVFIWHTVADEAVPVENSLLLASSLRAHKIPFELHLFQDGRHGLSTCDDEVNSPNKADHAWIDMSLRWLADRFDYQMPS